MLYNEFLYKTDPSLNSILSPSSSEEENALKKFKDFYEVFSYETVSKYIETVYSDDAYFRDSYKEVHSIGSIKKYFLKSAETVHTCFFDIHDIVSEKGEYYVRWTMRLKLKRNPNEEIIAPGMSHLRFSVDGMVIFHQDYWDSSLVFEKLPLIGGILRWIKSRF